MSAYDNCVGVAFASNKEGVVRESYFFVINSQGVMNYSTDESFLFDLFAGFSEGGSSSKIDDLNVDQIKQLSLKDYSISTGIKINEFIENYSGRSYFEIVVISNDLNDEGEKASNPSSLLLFSYKDENISQLFDFCKQFCYSKSEELLFEEKLTTNEHDNNQSLYTLKSVNVKTMRDVKYMEEIITKLDGKFVNQDDWDKDSIKVVNPTSDKHEYVESWVKLENGSDFSGPVKAGMPHGFGKEFRKDGLIYTGNFREGKWHGTGSITNINLDSYQGEFIDGCICGI